MLHQNLYCETKERNVQNYFLVNDKGDSVKIERSPRYFWIEFHSSKGCLFDGFTRDDDFEGDSYEFNTCINQIINDLFNDGFYNLF